MGKKPGLTSPAAARPASPRRRIRKAKAAPPPRSEVTLNAEELRCAKHVDRCTEFFCTNPDCLSELCAYCVLEHKEHIDEVQSLAEVVQQTMESSSALQVDRMQKSLWATQRKGLKELEALSDNIKSLLHGHINELKQQLILEDEKISFYLQTCEEAQQHFLAQSQREGKTDARALSCLKVLLQSRRRHKFSCFVVEEALLERQFDQLLNNYITLAPQGACLNSTGRDMPKFLHWFDWGKRDLHLFDVVNYVRKTVRVSTYLKIPCFSRSIIVPDGRIFLLGGEDPDHGPKRDCYVFKLSALPADAALHPVAALPAKKYDFAVCFHLGHIYALCGKGVNADILDSCERYSVERNCWSSIAPVKKKRYAASAAVAMELDRVYLFGGRSDLNHQMIEEIEEYNVAADCWKVIVLKNPGVFTPVEVSSAAQIGVGRILIFGGSDSSIQDTTSTYVFHYGEHRMERVGALKKAHVFVNLPFVQGSQVFAVGNEYYVKARSIHRFNIDSYEWDLLF